MDSEATALIAINNDRVWSFRATLNFEILSMTAQNGGNQDKVEGLHMQVWVEGGEILEKVEMKNGEMEK